MINSNKPVFKSSTRAQIEDIPPLHPEKGQTLYTMAGTVLIFARVGSRIQKKIPVVIAVVRLAVVLNLARTRFGQTCMPL